MRSPKDKYNNDINYRQLVDMLECVIHEAKFTPSEIREASILACINHEMRIVRPMRIPVKVHDAFLTLEEYAESEDLS